MIYFKLCASSPLLFITSIEFSQQTNAPKWKKKLFFPANIWYSLFSGFEGKAKNNERKYEILSKDTTIGWFFQVFSSRTRCSRIQRSFPSKIDRITICVHSIAITIRVQLISITICVHSIAISFVVHVPRCATSLQHKSTTQNLRETHQIYLYWSLLFVWIFSSRFLYLTTEKNYWERIQCLFAE